MLRRQFLQQGPQSSIHGVRGLIPARLAGVGMPRTRVVVLGSDTESAPGLPPHTERAIESSNPVAAQAVNPILTAQPAVAATSVVPTSASGLSSGVTPPETSQRPTNLASGPVESRLSQRSLTALAPTNAALAQSMRGAQAQRQ